MDGSNVHLSDKSQYALRTVALGKVFRTYNSTEFKITGPCSSKVLWSLVRMDLISDPPGGPLKGRHCMVLTPKGAEKLRAFIGSDLGYLGVPREKGAERFREAAANPSLGTAQELLMDERLSSKGLQRPT